MHATWNKLLECFFHDFATNLRQGPLKIKHRGIARGVKGALSPPGGFERGQFPLPLGNEPNELGMYVIDLLGIMN